MYNADRFMQFAPDHLTIQINKASIDEVRDVRINDEMSREFSKKARFKIRKAGNDGNA